LHVSIRQKAILVLTVVLRDLLLVDEPPVGQPDEEVLGQLVVLWRVGALEDIEGHADFGKVFAPPLMPVLRVFAGVFPFQLGCYLNRSSVVVCARGENDFVSLLSAEPRVDVAGQIR
jgi:hypothetical protein